MMWPWSRPAADPTLKEALDRGRFQPQGALQQIPFAVFDCETTGFHPYSRDRMIALAALQTDTGNMFETMINPGRPIPTVVTDLTGISNAHTDTAPDIAEVLPPFFAFVGQRVMVAHFAPFDRAFVQAALRRAGQTRWVHPLLDTQELAHALFPAWGDYRLEHCASMLNLRVEGRHTALGDVHTTAAILQALLAEATLKGISTWGDLQHLLATRQIW